MLLATARLTEKFQITIPVKVRRRMGLRAGDMLLFEEKDGRVVLRVEHGGWVASTRGLGADLWSEAGGVAALEGERESWR